MERAKEGKAIILSHSLSCRGDSCGHAIRQVADGGRKERRRRFSRATRLDITLRVVVRVFGPFGQNRRARHFARGALETKEGTNAVHNEWDTCRTSNAKQPFSFPF